MKAQKATKASVRAAKRRHDALMLRTKGKIYVEIAEELGISLGRAYGLVQEALLDLREVTAETAIELREIEVARLDRYLAAAEAKLQDDDVTKAGVPIALLAVDRALKVAERRANLLGVDAKSDEAAALETIGKEIGALARSVLGDEAADKLTEALARDT